MRVEWYIDPQGEPWRISEEDPGQSVAMDVPFRNEDGPETHDLMLRFARKGRSNRFYLVGVVHSEWSNHDLEWIARSCG